MQSIIFVGDHEITGQKTNPIARQLMRKILIFEPYLSGHRLEYIHHLHEEAAKTPDSHYYFALSDRFADRKKDYLWSEADNITFLYIDNRDILSLSGKRKIQRIAGLVGIASKLSKQYGVNETFFITLAEYMPWLPLFFRSRASVSGILYSIYLYDWKSKGFISRTREALTTLSVVPFRKYKHVFLLNDPVAGIYLNKRYNTQKFHYLPDPYMPLEETAAPDSEEEAFYAEDGKKIFLHFGSMSLRKGTLNILQAIGLLSPQELKDCRFVFAGKVNGDIKEVFYTLTEALKNRAPIHVFDAFCSPSFLASLCEACSVILAPYYNTSFSSGIIGYAANYRKPVAVPHEKLLGKLVRRYRLGYLLKDNSPQSIARFIKDTPRFLPIDGSRYVNTHSVHDFVRKTMLFEK